MVARLAVLAIVAWAAVVELTLRVIPACEVEFAGWILRLVEVIVVLEVAVMIEPARTRSRAQLELRRDRIPRARIV